MRSASATETSTSATSSDGEQIAKIDSPRHVLVRPGAREDRLSRADWARLLPQLAKFGLEQAARDARS